MTIETKLLQDIAATLERIEQALKVDRNAQGYIGLQEVKPPYVAGSPLPTLKLKGKG